MKITRTYTHKEHGTIGTVDFELPAGEFKLNGKTLNEAAVRHLATFALQTFQDAYAASKTAAEAKGAFDKKLDKVIAGTIGTVTRETDPVAREAKRIATEKVDAAAKAKGMKLPKERRAELIAQLSARADIQKQAKANVAAAKALVVDDDLLAMLDEEEGEESESDESTDDDETEEATA